MSGPTFGDHHHNLKYERRSISVDHDLIATGLFLKSTNWHRIYDAGSPGKLADCDTPIPDVRWHAAHANAVGTLPPIITGSGHGDAEVYQSCGAFRLSTSTWVKLARLPGKLNLPVRSGQRGPPPSETVIKAHVGACVRDLFSGPDAAVASGPSSLDIAHILANNPTTEATARE